MIEADSDAKERVEQRSKYERFSMTVCGGDGSGYVNICNQSHNDDVSHTYSVRVEDGSAVDCSCPHATYRNEHCKHQTAVEQRPIVVASAASLADSYNGSEVANDDRFRVPEDPRHVPEDEVDEDDSHSERTVVDAYADRVEERKKVDDTPL